MVEKEEVFEEKKSDFHPKLHQFFDFAKDLHHRGLLDGEILVAQGSQVLLNLKNLTDEAYVDPSKQSQFMIGSVSKQFFAVALLKALYESSNSPTEELKIADVKKKLHLPISQFLPQDAAIWDKEMPAWADHISLHHLLSHTSGIPNYTEVEEFSSSDMNDLEKYWFETYHSSQEIIKLIVKDPLLFSPGSDYSYSNTGYVLIAEIIKTITTMKPSEYVQKTLIEPLGLSSTLSLSHGTWSELKDDPKLAALIAPLKYDPTGDKAYPYPLIHCDDLSTALGTGSIISTSSDLLKWNQALHKKQSVLPKELYRLLVTANQADYGYGIGIENSEIGLTFAHKGKIGSYQTLLFYIPSHDLSVILLSNISYDFDCVEKEFNRLFENLTQAIPDEKERDDQAMEEILEKYPNQRGFELVSKKFDQMFFDEFS